MDTNVIIGAFGRHERDCRELIEAGRDGRAVLAVSRTLDSELTSSFVDDDLWPYVKGLPRLLRPSAEYGRALYGEAVYGYGGVGEALVRKQGERQVQRNLRDGEHIDGADIWGADAFVTSEERLWKRKRIKGVRMLTPSEALGLIFGTLDDLGGG